MENVMEYVLNLSGNLDDKLRRIGGGKYEKQTSI
jgi:hypothetical protein